MVMAFIPLYIRYLGIEAYGLIGLFAVLQTWLGLLDIGMTPTLGREMARFTGGSRSAESIRDLLRTIEIIAVGIALVMAAGIALGSNAIATSWLKGDTLPTSTVAQAFAIMGLVTALRFVEGVYRSAIVGLQRQVLFNLINSLMVTLRSLGAVGILIWVSPTIEAFFLWQGVVSVATLVTLALTTYHTIPQGSRSAQFSLPELRSIWRFAGGMMGITFLSLLLMQVDKILLSRFLSLSDFGYYTLATTVAGALNILANPIINAFYPRFCELHARSDHAGLVLNYHKGAQLVSTIIGSAAIVLMLYAQTFLTLWTQDAALAASSAYLVSLLTLGTLLNTLVRIPYQLLLAYGWTRLSMYSNLVAVLLIVPAIVWAIPRYGTEGVAVAWVLLNAGYCLISAQIMYLKILPTEKWRWYGQDVLAPLLAAGLVVLGIKALWPAPGTPLTQIAVLAVASLSALAASIVVCRHIRQQMFLLGKLLLPQVS